MTQYARPAFGEVKEIYINKNLSLQFSTMSWRREPTIGPVITCKPSEGLISMI